MAAWCDRPESKKEMETALDRELVFYRKLLFEEGNKIGGDISPPHSPTKFPTKQIQAGKGGFMTFTTISPKNQFKKVLSIAKDKELSVKTCSFIKAY